jgi:serine phosphatase RsbU (regulator of sigma subunit)
LPTNHDSHRTGDWPSPAQFRKSIRTEFALYVGGVVLLLMLFTGAIVTSRMVETVTQNVEEKLLVQARSYASAAGKQIIAAEGPDALMLNDICRKLAGDNKDLGWVGIAGKDGLFLAHTDLKQVISGGALHPPIASTPASSTREGESLVIEQDSINVTVPILDQSVLLGHLALASSTREISAVRRSSIATVSLITLIMLLLGIPATMMVLSRRLKPLRTITNSLQRVDVQNIAFELPIQTANEFGYLAETLRVMAGRVQEAQKQMVESERMSRELEIAREIQINILPKKYPTGDGFQFAGSYLSAQTVGGDYYDFIQVGPNRLAIVIADVSGKSLPGMLVMLMTRDLLVSHARVLQDPPTVLSAVNRDLLNGIRKGTFVTMFYGVLDTASGHFQFASAGHNPIIHRRESDRTFRFIKTKGYPLGMMPAEAFDKRIETGEIMFEPGDFLIQYTDGINEAMDASQKEYGLERLESVVIRGAGLSAEGLTSAVMNDVSAFVGDAPRSDDMTLLAMKWTGRAVTVAGEILKDGQSVASSR